MTIENEVNDIQFYDSFKRIEQLLDVVLPTFPLGNSPSWKSIALVFLWEHKTFCIELDKGVEKIWKKK